MAVKRQLRRNDEVLFLSLVCVAILTPIGYYFPQSWFAIFVYILSWTISDYLVARLELERRGAIRFGVYNRTISISRRSWAVVPYLIAITLGSILGDLGSLAFIQGISALSEKTKDAKTAFFLVGSFVIYVAVFFDVNFRAYDARRRREQRQSGRQPEPSTDLESQKQLDSE